MKSFLRFALLFALIVAGKITKQSTAVRSTVKVLQRNNALVLPATPFFTRQVSSPATAAGAGQFWQTAGKREQQVQFE